ncbi:hypothetical protein BKA69DRAFT_1178847 [Paraphysoderma sedebokerense]|nr:hypothetical protein BKA69DRAFT_1178847 [Paraphysoderma sedebokerense]
MVQFSSEGKTVASFVATVLLLLQVTSVESHSWLVAPTARGGVARNDAGTGNSAQSKAPACGWRGKNAANPSGQTFQRGQTIPVRWPRNNHPGGFIRLSLVPFGSPQTHEDFNNNIVQYNCHETDCKSGYGDPLGGDGQGYGDGQNICSTTFTIPNWVQDGQYTLQWMWMGGGSYYGDVNRGQTDFYQCSDFTVRGSAGSSNSTALRRPACPVYKPGDVHSRGKNPNTCFYFNQGNKPGMCTPEGCRGTYKFGVPQELVDTGCINAQGSPLKDTEVGNSTVAPAGSPSPTSDNTGDSGYSSPSPSGDNETPESKPGMKKKYKSKCKSYGKNKSYGKDESYGDKQPYGDNASGAGEPSTDAENKPYEPSPAGDPSNDQGKPDAEQKSYDKNKSYGKDKYYGKDKGGKYGDKSGYKNKSYGKDKYYGKDKGGKSGDKSGYKNKQYRL